MMRITIEFQSHLGSISTKDKCTRASARHGFNPTLVRLALDDLLGIREFVPGFNPTLVRLAPFFAKDTV